MLMDNSLSQLNQKSRRISQFYRSFNTTLIDKALLGIIVIDLLKILNYSSHFELESDTLRN